MGHKIELEQVIGLFAEIGIARAALERAKDWIIAQNDGFDPRIDEATGYPALENDIADGPLIDLLNKIDMGITGKSSTED